MLVLTTAVSVSAHANTYPTAKLTKKTSSVKRGKTALFKFRCSSGSYTRLKNGIWPAEIDVDIYNSNGTRVAYNGNGRDGKWFSGENLTYNLKWKVPSNLKRGQYKVRYRTYFNKSNTGYSWYYNKYTTDRYFYITVK